MPKDPLRCHLAGVSLRMRPALLGSRIWEYWDCQQ
jgi:hypothetical protein